MGNLKYSLYTGCTARESTPELLKSTMAVAEKLGIELELLDEASCCGASHLQDFDDFLSLVLNARNICYAEKKGLDIVTICNTCQLNLSMAKERLDADAELKARVNEKLAEVGLEYKGTSRVTHMLYILKNEYGYEKLKAEVVKPLSNFNIAPFYGCHNIRPSELQNHNNSGENAYKPTAIDELIVILGGKNVEYAEKNKCCGFHVELQAPKTANKLSGSAMMGAKEGGADMVVTPCPLCQIRMDVQQHNIAKEVNSDITMPVLHIQQMVGLALGLSEKELGLNHNMISLKA